MSSPFPSMDPYLEAAQLWPAFRHELLVVLMEQLAPRCADRYQVQIVQRPDGAGAGGQETQPEEHLEIRERKSGDLVTFVDVVSPRVKTVAACLHEYLQHRREGTALGANLVEIDLVLQGRSALEYTRDGLPPLDYAVTVARVTHPGRYEIYWATLQKPLPRFRLPLAKDERDPILSLEEIFALAYDRGDFGALIDYRAEPPVAIPQESTRWLQELLHLDKLPRVRSAETNLNHEAIAVLAYYLWEREGRPAGRDREHWYQAIKQLQGA